MPQASLVFVAHVRNSSFATPWRRRVANHAWIQEVQENLQKRQYLASLPDTTQQRVSCSQMALAAILVTRLTLPHGQWWGYVEEEMQTEADA